MHLLKRRSFLLFLSLGLILVASSCSDLWKPSPPELADSPAWLAGGYGNGPGQFQQLSASATGPEGTIVVADNRLKRLTFIGPDGHEAAARVHYDSAEGSPSLSDDGFSSIGGLSWRDGKLFILTGDGVWSYPSGSRAQLLFKPELPSRPVGFTVGEDGQVFLTTSDEVFVFSTVGVLLRSWKLEGEKVAVVRAATVDPDGNLVVAVGGWNAIVVFSPSGEEVSRIPAAGGVSAPFKDVRDVAVNEDGFIFAFDYSDRSVVLLDPVGAELKRFGGRGSAPGQVLKSAQLIMNDEASRLAVIDSGNFRIQAWDLEGDDVSPDDYVSHSPEFVPSPKPDHLVLTLGDRADTERRFAWRTDAATTGSVLQIVPLKAGTQASAVDWSGGEAATIQGTSEIVHGNVGPYAAHEVAAAELEPGARYAYRVGDGGENWSEPQMTEIVRLTQKVLRTVILGDSRNRMDVWELIVKASSGHDPAFIINTGDLVADGENMNDWSPWFDRAKGVIDRIPLMSCMGNHESQSPNYFHAFALPPNGPEGFIEEAYSFDYGPVHWVVLNTTTDLEPQTAWLEADLAATKQPWVFAVFHRPAYAGHPTRGDGNIDVREAWVPILEKYGVALAWQGHDHYYFRTKSILAGEVVEPGAGTIYVTTGGSGAPLYPIEKNKYAETAESVDHYCVVDVSEAQVKVTVYRADESLLDTFTLKAKGSRRAAILAGG